MLLKNILKFYTQSKSELTLFVYEAGLGDRMTESGRWHFVELGGFSNSGIPDAYGRWFILPGPCGVLV